MKKAIFFWILLTVTPLLFSSSILAQETVTKYLCACGKMCDCGTIANKPGKCVCGKEMKKEELSKEEFKKMCPVCGEWQKSKEGEAPTTGMKWKRSREKVSPTY